MSNGINFSSIADVALMAVGSAFGGPIGALVAQLAKQVIGSVLDQIVEQLPLDQSAKDALQAGVHTALGDTQGAIKNVHEFIDDLGREWGLPQSDIDSMHRSVSDFQSAATETASQQSASQETTAQQCSAAIAQQGLDQMDEGDDGGAVKGKGGKAAGAGWLVAMAKALGQKIDKYAHEMEAAADAVDKNDPSTSTDFQVLSQEFSIVMNAATTAIKTAGEAVTTAARKN